MELIISFTFRNSVYSCTVLIDNTQYPFFIFVILYDQELIKEFGDEVTIKTDFERQLPKYGEDRDLEEIKQAIFAPVRNIPEFVWAKMSATGYKKHEAALG